jgi:hypothetical protein
LEKTVNMRDYTTISPKIIRRIMNPKVQNKLSKLSQKDIKKIVFSDYQKEYISHSILLTLLTQKEVEMLDVFFDEVRGEEEAYYDITEVENFLVELQPRI